MLNIIQICACFSCVGHVRLLQQQHEHQSSKRPKGEMSVRKKEGGEEENEDEGSKEIEEEERRKNHRSVLKCERRCMSLSLLL